MPLSPASSLGSFGDRHAAVLIDAKLVEAGGKGLEAVGSSAEATAMRSGAMRERVEQDGLCPAATIPAHHSPCLKERDELRQPYPVEYRSEIHDGARHGTHCPTAKPSTRAAACNWERSCAMFHCQSPPCAA